MGKAFPFPSNGNAHRKSKVLITKSSKSTGFHSLQTGKWIPSIVVVPTTPCGYSNRFNSLQTGTQIQRNYITIIYIYKRFCFHSLQTGKPIQRKEALSDRESFGSSFPFPSNGKADPKTTGVNLPRCLGVSFHSLQTGKPIQSYHKIQASVSFGI